MHLLLGVVAVAVTAAVAVVIVVPVLWWRQRPLWCEAIVGEAVT